MAQQTDHNIRAYALRKSKRTYNTGSPYFSGINLKNACVGQKKGEKENIEDGLVHNVSGYEDSIQHCSVLLDRIGH